MTNSIKEKANTYQVDLRGTWHFDCTVWADTPEDALDEAISTIEDDFGTLDLVFQIVTVTDEATGEEMLEWTGD